MSKLTMADVKVSKVMTRNLVTVFLGSMVEEAVRKIDFDVEYLPVVDSKGILHGLLTFREIMAKDLVTCNLSCTFLDVVKLMKNKHLRRIPVVNAKNKLMGLVTDFDLALFGWDFK